MPSRKVLYLPRKLRASAGREEAPFSLAIIFQVAKSARAWVSARLAIILSGALIKIASVLWKPNHCVHSMREILSSISRAAAGNVEHRAGGKRAILRRQP